MPQNRNKLIKLFVGNASNFVIHKVLEAAIDEENIRKHYEKEFNLSFDIAKKYREKINPTNRPLPLKDTEEIKKEIQNRAFNELNLRIKAGYKNIDLTKISVFTEKILSELNVKD